MNPLYALRQWRYAQGHRTPWVAAAQIDHAAVQARWKRRTTQQRRRQARAEQIAAARLWAKHRLGFVSQRWQALAAWVAARLDLIGSHLAVAWLALTAAWFMAAQPVIDAADEARFAAEAATTRATAEREQWKAIATTSAERSITLNLSGHAGEVRDMARRIAAAETKR